MDRIDRDIREGYTPAAPVQPVYRRDLAARSTIAGLFADRDHAAAAIRDLEAAGFPRDQIGVVMRDRTEQGELVEETGTHAGDGAATGIVVGGIAGGVLGYLIATGALLIPGIGPVVAGGVLASALGIVGGTTVAGAGIGAAALGIVGALIGLGIPEHEARHFEQGIHAGGTLVTLTAPGRLAEAAAIMERHGGDTGAALAPAGYAAPVAAPVAPVAPVAPAAANPAGVRVRKRTVTEMQTIQVPVTREEYVVERPDGTVADAEPSPAAVDAVDAASRHAPRAA